MMQLRVFVEPTGLVSVISDLKSSMGLPRAQGLAAGREEGTKIEGIAKSAGCNEMRLGGRRWAHVLTDYEPLAGVTNGLRKALT